MNQDIAGWLSSDDAIIRFKKALEQQAPFWSSYLETMPEHFQALVMLRDWQGRFHLGVPTLAEVPTGEIVEKVAALRAALMPLAHDDFVFYSGEMFDPDDLWINSDSVSHPWGVKAISVRWIERQSKEKIWTQQPHSAQIDPEESARTISPKRAAFFGIKGGVGRSSALLALAWHLIQQGKKVLVLDADFESPGLSSTLLSEDLKPDFGLIDWFAAYALQPELATQLIRERFIFERSSIDKLGKGSGTIWVAPAFGKKTQDYVTKLGRIYQDTPPNALGITGYAQRFTHLLEALEAEVKPDVVLIDSRAGVDDTAAVALTQLGAYGFLFASHSRQTWAAYELLFKHWQRYAKLEKGGEDFRSMLRIVSALTPDDSGAMRGYFDKFCDTSYEMFLNYVYEPLAADELEHDGFNFARHDADSPHKPSRIRWDESLKYFDPLENPSQLESHVFNKAFGDFVSTFDALLIQDLAI